MPYFGILLMIFLIIAIIVCLVRKAIKVALILALATCMYGMFFVWSGSQASEKLHMDAYLKDQPRSKTIEFINDLRQREKDIYGDDNN